jgi:hypothetical protein
MATQQSTDQAPRPVTADRDETHEEAVRIARERLEKDRRLHEVEREAVKAVPHELHTSIGD